MRRTIGPDGGLISSHDKVLSIYLPENALPEDTEIEIFPSDEPPLVFGPAYRVRPNVPLEVRAQITYRRVLPKSPDDTDIAAIHLDDYENENGWWVPLPRLNLDVDHDSVLASDDELSLYYALLEDANGAEDDGGETSTDGGSTDEGDTEPGMLSHAADIQPIWDANCLGPGCHEPPSAGNGLDLKSMAYEHLIGVFATGANLPLVDPGNVDNSFLFYKLEGTQAEVNGSGSPMPLGKPKLDDATLATIRMWIEQGAAP